jgi:class 3 adenylate cyclase/predicted ATPase
VRCTSCNFENATGKKFCIRCGCALALTCSKCGSENPTEACFCGDCGAALSATARRTATAEVQETSGGEPFAGEHRQLTVLFCDLVGSTALSGLLDPEEYRNVMLTYDRVASDVIARFAGHVAQYQGDGIVAYFGWPAAHGDDAERAVRAGLSLLEAIEKTNCDAPIERRIEVRVGIHTGPVVVGEVGGVGSVGIAALGETPNVAARVQATAEPNSVLITAATHRLIVGVFVEEDLRERTLRGVSRPINLYRVLRASGARSRFHAAAARGLTPFVGREEQRTLLRGRFDLVEEGEGQVAVITGEAGIGKSRLVEQFRDDLGENPHSWVEASCSPFSQETPFAPMVDLLNNLVAFRGEESPQERLTALEQRLDAVHLKQPETIRLLGELLNIPVPEQYPKLSISPEAQRIRLIATLVNWVTASARTQTIVLTLEDLQWADPSTLDLYHVLTEQAATVPLMVILTARPEFRIPWPVRAHHMHLTLGRLNRRQTREMATRVTATVMLPEDLLSTVVERTDGVPLFVEELTKVIVEPAGATTIAEHNVPVTLADSLMARLDRLGEAKEIAQIASIIGREFSYAMLAAIAGKREAELGMALSLLVDAELVHARGIAPEASYLFKHALVQDIAYQSLLRTKRRFYHRRIAEVLEQRFPQSAETQPELVGHHYSEAGLAEPAIPYWRRAGERAAKRGSNVEAVSHLRRGLALIETVATRAAFAEEELLTLMVLGPALMTLMSSSAPEVQQVYARARQLAENTGKLSELFTAIWGSWLVAITSGDSPALRRFADELFSIARDQHDTGFLLQSHHAAWPTAFFFGEIWGMHEYVGAGLALYNKDAHRSHALLYAGHDPAVCGYTLDATGLQILGYPEQALVQLERGLELARELGHLPTTVHALWFGAELYFLRGDARMTLQLMDQWLPMASRYASTAGAANMTILRGWSIVTCEDSKAGLSLIREGVDRLRATGSRFQVAYRLGRAVAALHRAGETTEAMALLSDSFEAINTIGECWYEAELCRMKGELLLAQESLSARQAEDSLRDAIKIARRQSAKSWELRATTSLARLLMKQRRTTEASAMLADIYGWFSEGFDTADLKDAKGLLEQLNA